MMTHIAFQGDPGVKAQALSRLRRHIAAGTFVYAPAWEDGKASAIGAVVEADDNAGYAERLGYPLAAVIALGSILNAFRDLGSAGEFAEAWLARTPVGADLSNVVSQAIAIHLDEPQLTALTAQAPELERSRQDVLALHRRVVGGDEPDRKEWKAVRLAAVAASDAVAGDQFLQIAGAIIEAAVWPASMRSVLNDTLSGFGKLELQQGMNAIGWSDGDESRVYKMMEKAEAEGRLAELPGLDRVLALLDADDAGLAKGFRERLALFDQLGGPYRAAGWKLLELFEQAPVVAPDAAGAVAVAS